MGPDLPQPSQTQTERKSYAQEIVLKSDSSAIKLHPKGAQILSLNINGFEIFAPRTILRALAFKNRTGEIDTSGDGGSFLGFPWSRYWLKNTASNVLKMIHGPTSIAALTWATKSQSPTSITMTTGGIEHDSKNAREIFGNDLFSLERNISLTHKTATVVNTVRYDGQRPPDQGQAQFQNIDLKLAEHPYFKASPYACFYKKNGSTILISDLLNQNGDLKEPLNLTNLLGSDDEIWYMPEGENGHVVRIKISATKNKTDITSSTDIILWKDPKSSGYICIEPVLTLPSITDLHPSDTFSQTITISTANSLEELQAVT